MGQYIAFNKSILLIVIVLMISSLTVGWLYLNYGHQCIKDMYAGTSMQSLNILIKGQSILPVEHYIGKIDRLFCSILLGTLLILIFILLIYSKKNLSPFIYFILIIILISS